MLTNVTKVTIITYRKEVKIKLTFELEINKKDFKDFERFQQKITNHLQYELWREIYFLKDLYSEPKKEDK